MVFPKKILMSSPEHFDVVYKINPHMNLENKVNKTLANAQWDSLRSIYENIGFDVEVIPGRSDLPDLVFMANQLISTRNGVILSRMNNIEREPEVDHIKNHLNIKNYFRPQNTFESMGDCIEDYQGKRFFCGHGFRTKKEVYEEINNYLPGEKVLIKLNNEKFYHLDTCLCIVDNTTAFYVKSAFDENGLSTLEKSFQKLIEVDEMEAEAFLACNAHCPDGVNIIVEENAIKLKESARNLGLKVHSVDTSEFLKSGGSIFCLKNQFWDY